MRLAGSRNATSKHVSLVDVNDDGKNSTCHTHSPDSDAVCNNSDTCSLMLMQFISMVILQVRVRCSLPET